MFAVIETGGKQYKVCEGDIIFIEKLCAEAAKWDFASVCINPCNIELAKKLLAGTNVEVCTVIGFPLGANKPCIKAMEAAEAIRDGADEVEALNGIEDLVVNGFND